MKIVHVCPSVGEQMGGSERYVSNIAKQQARHDEVEIFTTTRNRRNTGVFNESGVTTRRFYSPVMLWKVNPISLMIRPLLKSNPDVIHIHSYVYFISNQAAITSRSRTFKSLIHLHGGVGSPPYKAALSKRVIKYVYDRTLGKLTLHSCDLIGSVSLTDIEKASNLFSIPKGRFRYLPNIVDVTKFTPRSKMKPENNRILYVGDLEHWKGVGLLTKWLAHKTLWNGTDIVFQFVGQGSLMPELLALKEQCEKRNNGVTIEVVGELQHDEIPAIMNRASAVVLPSYWEGVPTVVLEGMASGIPVIATPMGDLKRLLTNGENSLVIDHTLESFREAVFTALNDESLIGRIVRNARKLVERNFSLQDSNRLVRQVYNEMLQ